MTQRFGLPTVAEVAEQTPADRDRAIDVIRIASLIGVVVGHAVMATSIIRDDVFVWDNLLTAFPAFQPLTWIFQVMPLFFFAGAAASIGSWRAGATWGGWLMRRCTRLYRPVFSYLAFWAVALLGLRNVLPENVHRPIAGISIQLLWFVGGYVLVLATVPLLHRITTTVRLVAGVAGIYGLVAVVDTVRAQLPTTAPLGYLNMIAWVIPGIFGIGYRRGLLTGRAAVCLALLMLSVDILLCWHGPYEVSLVGVEGQRLPNMAPPSLLLAGHAIVLSAFAIAAAPAITRWAHRPRVWWLTAIGNSGAMTLYLWHMPVLLAVHLAFDYLGWPRYPGQPHLVALSVLQLVLVVALVGVAFVALRPLENAPLPGWDGAPATIPGRRGAAVGTLLCVAALANLISVKWGLKDEGLYCVAVMLAGLAAARMLAATARSDGG